MMYYGRHAQSAQDCAAQATLRQRAKLCIEPVTVVDCAKLFEKNSEQAVTVYYFEVHRGDGAGYVRCAISANDAKGARYLDAIFAPDASILSRARELAKYQGTMRLLDDWIQKNTPSREH